MEIMKNLMSELCINLDEIRKHFFEKGDNCNESIKSSMTYIVSMCRYSKKSIWDFVRDELLEIENDKEYTEYQKNMVKSSLLLGWEELEKNNEEICLELHKYSHN